MKKSTKAVVVTALTAGLVAGLAASAPAGSDKKAEKFCKAALEVDLQVGTVPGLTSTNLVEVATETRKGLKKLVKLAPTKNLRKALKVLVKYYGEIAEAGDLNLVEYGEAQQAAVATLTEYAGTTCVPLLTAST